MKRWWPALVVFALLKQSAGCDDLSPDCYVQECIDDACTLSFPAMGTPVPNQIAGDCHMQVCDGQGHVISVPDDNELSKDDGNPCTLDQCLGGNSHYPPKSEGSPCSPDGQCFSGTCFATLCNGTLGFPNPPARILGPNPTDLEPLDLNGDGKDDVAVTDEVNNVVSIVLGHGDGTFGQQTDYPVGLKPSAVDSGDVNGDGLADLVVANQDGNSLSVLFSNGDGTLAPAVDYAGATNSTFVHLGDMNGDGRLDIVTNNSTPNATTIFLNDGMGGFGQTWNLTVTGRPKDVEVVDMNNDGRLDVVAIYGGETIGIYRNDMQGIFTLTHTLSLFSLSDAADFVEAADFNQDGRMDIAVAYHAHGWLLVQNANGGFNTPSGFFGSLGGYDISVANLNGDAYPDIVVAGAGGPLPVSRVINPGAPSHSFERTPLQAVKGKMANLDGMGTPGYIALTGSVGGLMGITNIATDSGIPEHRFVPISWQMAMGDMNNDGLIDFVTRDDSPRLTVTLRDANGGFHVQPPLVLGLPTRDLKLGDVNNDGALDVLLAGQIFSTWFLNLGAGNLDPLYQIYVTPGSLQVSPGDFNADGHLDFAYTPDAGNPALAISTNLGNGTFTTTATYPLSMPPKQIASADLDNDGDLDLLVVISLNTGVLSGAVTALLNDGTGQFVAHDYPVAGAVTEAAITDFNGDGYVDMATRASYTSNNRVSLLFNNGDGSFAPAMTMPGTESVLSMQVADLNGDGKIDLALGDATRGGIAVYLNPGNGVFGPHHLYSVDGVFKFLAADVNGDHRVDLYTLKGWYMENTCLQ